MVGPAHWSKRRPGPCERIDPMRCESTWPSPSWGGGGIGCAPEVSIAELESLGRDTSSESGLVATSVEHDLGVVIAAGQTIPAAFELRNPTTRPIRIVEARPSTPCCSAVEPFEADVEPGGKTSIPVVFRPGRQVGTVRIGFGVRTDDPDAEPITLALLANVQNEAEIACVEGCGASLQPGEPAVQVVEVRRVVATDAAEPPPPTLTTSAGLTATPIEESARVEPIGDHWRRHIRRVRVEPIEAIDPGTLQGRIAAAWPDRATAETGLTWRVLAPLQVVPSGLRIDAALPGRQTLLVTSSTRDVFRVLKVDGPLTVSAPGQELPTAPAASHRLELEISPGAATTPGGTYDLAITTDHPRQAEALVSVLVVEGDGP